MAARGRNNCEATAGMSEVWFRPHFRIVRIGILNVFEKTMIDKLEVRVPATAEYTPAFGQLYSTLWNDPPNNPFRASRHYCVVGDLRAFGYDAILHAHCKHGEAGNHKLELLDTGIRSLEELLREIESVFQVSPSTLEIMRLDLAVDVMGVPVSVFQDCARAAYKRIVVDFENAEQFVRMGQRDIETIYLGKRPNCYRIYNKIAEYKTQYAKVQRQIPENFVPKFEDLYGYSPEGVVVTRVERQYGGSRIPQQISNVALLRENVETLHPFEPLEFLFTGIPEPDPGFYDLSTYLKGLGLRDLIAKCGLHRARRFINKKSPGNAARILNKLAEFIPSPSPDFSIPDLNELFQQSIRCQLNGWECQNVRPNVTLEDLLK